MTAMLLTCCSSDCEVKAQVPENGKVLVAYFSFAGNTKAYAEKMAQMTGGKTVIPFVTSGSSGISSVNSKLSSTYPDIKWKEGRRLNGMSDADLRSWLQNFVGTTAIRNVRSQEHVSPKAYTLQGTLAHAGQKGL